MSPVTADYAFDNNAQKFYITSDFSLITINANLAINTISQ